MSTSPELRAAIEALYVVFARYPLPVASHFSPIAGVTHADVHAIHALPLRSQSGPAFRKYALKALNTWGDQDEFRHYLPRIFELVMLDCWLPAAVPFEELDAGRWRSWPRVEQEVIEEVVVDVWKAIFAGTVDVALLPVAAGASTAGISLAPMVALWSMPLSIPAARQLAYVVMLERDDLLRHGTLGPRWSDEARATLGAMLQSNETRARLEKVFFEMGKDPDAEVVSLAIGLLETMPRAG